MAGGTKLSILHLSDIQFGDGFGYKSPDDAFSSLERDISLYWLQKIPVPEVVVISGDIINKDKTPAYEDALKFLSLLCSRLEIAEDERHRRLIIVPGNHDVNLKATPENEKLAAFEEFIDEVYKKKVKYNFGTLPGSNEKHYCLFSPREKINFIGFNSCEIISDGNSQGRVSVKYLKEAFEKEEQRLKDSINIAVWHHPVDKQLQNKNDYLSNFHEELKEVMFGTVDLVLHGHNHNLVVPDALKTESFEGQSEKNSLWAIGVGSFGVEPKERPHDPSLGAVPNQYNIIFIDLERKRFQVFARQLDPLKKRWIPYCIFDDFRSTATRSLEDPRLRYSYEEKLLGLGTGFAELENPRDISDFIKANISPETEIEVYGEVPQPLLDILITKLKLYCSERLDLEFFESAAAGKSLEYRYFPVARAKDEGAGYSMVTLTKEAKVTSVLIQRDYKFAYAFPGLDLRELFSHNRKHYPLIRLAKQIHDNVGPPTIQFKKECSDLISELNDGYFSPVLPSLRDDNGETWQRKLLVSYQQHGIEWLGKAKTVVITWDMNYGNLSSLVNTDAFQNFVRELNRGGEKRPEKVLRVVFVDLPYLLDHKKLNEYPGHEGKCFGELVAEVNYQVILDDLNLGKTNFAVRYVCRHWLRNRLGYYGERKVEPSDICYYLSGSELSFDDIKMVQGSKSLLYAREPILKVYFRPTEGGDQKIFNCLTEIFNVEGDPGVQKSLPDLVEQNRMQVYKQGDAERQKRFDKLLTQLREAEQRFQDKWSKTIAAQKSN